MYLGILWTGVTSLFYAEREWEGILSEAVVWKVVYRWATQLSFKSSGDYVVIRVVLPSKKISSFFKCLEKYSFQKHWYEVSSFLLQFSFYFSKMSCESDHIESRVHLEFH